MNNQKFLHGNYLGIVVANNDPLKKGRVKVYIPHISPSVYKNWNEISKDKKFKFLGKNIKSDLTDIIEDLKNILPWAECAAPILGEVSSGKYNSKDQQATISDSNSYSDSKPVENFEPTKFSQNKDGTGEKPANIYEKYDFALKDAFAAPGPIGANNANPYGFSYRPSSYSNKAKGSFAIPSVGAHLWVFFLEGNPMYPVYFASSHGSQEWQSFYDESDYPASYENKNPSSETDHNVEIYRNKYIINQKGGSLEFINTDNKESLKLTHYSGSFIQFSNPSTIYLSTANEQKLVLGDKFKTVRGSDNEYTDGDRDIIVKGDIFKKIGSLNSDATQRWKDVVQSFADIKQLFEIQRVTNKSLFNSSQQKKSGSYTKCPVCSQGRRYGTQQNSITRIASPVPEVRLSSNQVSDYTNVSPKGAAGSLQNLSFPVPGVCPSCGGSGLSKSSMGGDWAAEPLKQQLNQLIASKIVDIAKIEADIGLGGHEIIDITKHKIETIGTVMNDFGSIRIDTVGKMYNAEVLVDDQGVFENQIPSPLIEYVHVDDLPGGNYTLNVCNRYTLQVGAGGVSIKSFGPVNIGGTITNIAGEQVNISSSNEINIDGGNRLTLTADTIILKERYMKQVMVDSSLGVSRNLIVGGGAHIEGELSVNHITAPVEVQETELTKVYGQSNEESFTTGVHPVIGYVSGIPGDFVVDPPGSSQQWTRVYGRTITGVGVASPNCLYTYPHSHHFRNIPLTLVQNNNDLRNLGKKNNEVERNTASPQNDSKKGPSNL